MWYLERWKFMKCRSKKNYTLPSVCFWHSAKSLFAECCICTLGKELTAIGWFNGGPKFAECETLTLGKESLCRVACLSTRQRGRLCRVSKLSTRQRLALPRVVLLSSVRVWALGKDSLYRLPEIKKTRQSYWHSAKLAIPVVLDKDSLLSSYMSLEMTIYSDPIDVH